MRICVIIPAYNESKTIARLIKQILQISKDVVVIDDGSTDSTALISKEHGATVIKNTGNLGKGASLTLGLKYAVGNNFDAAITMDGDGQHLPEDITQFIKKAESEDIGIVIGNRMQATGNMPLLRVFTNRFMSWLISRIVGQKIPDTQCGFRLIKSDLIKKLKFTTQRFETESEILIQASRLGYKIESLAIKSIYQRERSQVNPLIDTIRFIGFICRQK